MQRNCHKNVRVSAAKRQLTSIGVEVFPLCNWTVVTRRRTPPSGGATQSVERVSDAVSSLSCCWRVTWLLGDKLPIEANG